MATGYALIVSVLIRNLAPKHRPDKSVETSSNPHASMVPYSIEILSILRRYWFLVFAFLLFRRFRALSSRLGLISY